MMAVGKTSIVRKFVNPDKKLNVKDTMSTMGVDQYKWYVRFLDTPIKIQIWDTAGQERFAKLTSNYIKPLDGVCLVFAFDSAESFNQTKNWRQSIAEAKDIPMILVGNKCDIPDKQVNVKDIEEKQEEFRCSFHECSALTGEGVQNAIYSIIYECLKPVE